MTMIMRSALLVALVVLPGCVPRGHIEGVPALVDLVYDLRQGMLVGCGPSTTHGKVESYSYDYDGPSVLGVGDLRRYESELICKKGKPPEDLLRDVPEPVPSETKPDLPHEGYLGS